MRETRLKRSAHHAEAAGEGRGLRRRLIKRWGGERSFHAHETARFDELNGLPLASFKQRAYALLIDGFIQVLLKAPLGGLLVWRSWHAAHGMDFMESVPELWEKIDELLLSGLYFSIALKLGKGQTPGKYLMKIKVISLEHDEITWWVAIERALGYGASFLEGGFGFFQYFIHRNRMCVHDRIAETIVIDLTRARSHAPLPHVVTSEDLEESAREPSVELQP